MSARSSGRSATTLDDLRRMAIAQTLFAPTTLSRALAKLGFVQADPIRAPARAQDLILRHRVAGYRAGDLEARYAELDVAEDFFVNYGFVTGAIAALMHPRPKVMAGAQGTSAKERQHARRARAIARFVGDRGEAHPRDVDARFAHGKVVNYWGGSSNATTQILDVLHYRGVLRVVRRDGGVRVYALRPRDPAPSRIKASERARRMDRLVDAVVALHAPLPKSTLGYYVRRLRYAVPQWRGEIDGALARARERLRSARVDGVEWFWPDGATATEPDDRARFLAPFDPIVHDRARFAMLWGWEYRFEAYTPVAKRVRGYYALPILHRERAIGWANVAARDDELDVKIGWASGRDRGIARAIEEEIERLRVFLVPR